MTAEDTAKTSIIIGGMNIVDKISVCDKSAPYISTSML